MSACSSWENQKTSSETDQQQNNCNEFFQNKDIRGHFGVMQPKNSPVRPMTRISQMFNVLNMVEN